MTSGKGFVLFLFTVALCNLYLVSAFNATADINFVLYTSANQTTGNTIKLYDKVTLDASGFDPTVGTRFIIHGWWGSIFVNVDKIIRSGYNSIKKKLNIIYVDWSIGAINLDYTTARNLVPVVGDAVGKFILWLNAKKGYPTKSVNLVGHSLGAHVAGIGGKTVNAAGKRITAIHALDPAYREFNFSDPTSVVWKTDAQYVEIIHTDVDMFGLGTEKVLGHADFYPSFGQYQPGCMFSGEVACSHIRALHYFAESVYSKAGFWGRQCQNYSEINNAFKCSGPLAKMGGEPSSVSNLGVFYVPVNSKSPYAVGQF